MRKIKKTSEKKPTVVKVPQEDTGPIMAQQRPLCWETFFRCQKAPLLRHQILMALMAGTPFCVERLPSAVLLDVLLVATAARQDCGAEVVDDYDGLVTRVRAAWARPDWTCRVFDSIHLDKANCILDGRTEFICSEDVYIPNMVGWYLQQDVPEYVAKELKK